MDPPAVTSCLLSSLTVLLDGGLKTDGRTLSQTAPSQTKHFVRLDLALTVGLAPRVMLRFLTRPVHKPDGSADARLASMLISV